jgi:hypothetical protein
VLQCWPVLRPRVHRVVPLPRRDLWSLGRRDLECRNVHTIDYPCRTVFLHYALTSRLIFYIFRFGWLAAPSHISRGSPRAATTHAPLDGVSDAGVPLCVSDDTVRHYMPSRQERRKAERDAAKRAPARSGAAGIAGAAGAAGAARAAAALANLNVNQLGDWTTQTDDPKALLQALGVRVVIQMAAEGDRAAQFSQGCNLIAELAGEGLSGAAGRSPQVEVGLAHTCTFRSLTRPDSGVASMIT